MSERRVSTAATAPALTRTVAAVDFLGCKTQCLAVRIVFHDVVVDFGEDDDFAAWNVVSTQCFANDRFRCAIGVSDRCVPGVDAGIEGLFEEG